MRSRSSSQTLSPPPLLPLLLPLEALRTTQCRVSAPVTAKCSARRHRAKPRRSVFHLYQFKDRLKVKRNAVHWLRGHLKVKLRTANCRYRLWLLLDILVPISSCRGKVRFQGRPLTLPCLQHVPVYRRQELSPLLSPNQRTELHSHSLAQQQVQALR